MKKMPLIAIVVAILSLLGIYYSGFMYSPGAIHAKHAKVIKNCTTCHKPFTKPTGETCIAAGCHDVAYWKGKKGVSTIHLSAKECSGCHTEHQGADGNITFAPAHVNISKDSNCLECHRLGAVHIAVTNQDCKLCHGMEAWRPAKFDHKSMTKADNCAKCHQLPDKHFRTDKNCAECHDTNKWKPARFNHRFPIQHGAGRMGNTCETCHPKSLNEYDCYSGCHDHTPAGIERKHYREGINNFANCVKCHPTGREHEGEGIGEGDEGHGENGEREWRRERGHDRRRRGHDDDDD